MFKITVPQVFPYYSTIIHSCQLSKIKVIIFSISLDLILIMRYNSIQVLSARVAQSVEQLIRNQQVVGSSPIFSSTAPAYVKHVRGIFHNNAIFNASCKYCIAYVE